MEFVCCADINCCGECGLRCDGCLQQFGETCNCTIPSCTTCLDSMCPTKGVIILSCLLVVYREFSLQQCAQHCGMTDTCTSCGCPDTSCCDFGDLSCVCPCGDFTQCCTDCQVYFKLIVAPLSTYNWSKLCGIINY